MLNAALGPETRRVPPSQEASEGGRGVAGEGRLHQASEKAWAAAKIVKAAKKGKELKTAAASGASSAKQPTKTEEAWSYADVPAKTSTGWTPPGDVKYAVEDAEQLVER